MSTNCEHPECPQKPRRARRVKRSNRPRPNRAVGDAVRQRRLQMGMSLYDLSIELCQRTQGSHTHLQPSRISEMELGKRLIDYPMLCKIAAVLECKPGELAGKVKPPAAPAPKSAPKQDVTGSDFSRILSNIQR